MMFRYLLGDGAELRILQPHLAPEFFAFVNSNRAHLSAWLLWAQRMQTLDEARAFLQEGMDDFARDELPVIGIWQDNALAGGIAFFPLDRRSKSAELAYWLGQAYAGRGLMTRAVRATFGYLFEQLKVNRIVIRVEVNNTRSRALAERLGFQLETIARDGWIHAGEFVDLAEYALLARDFDSRDARTPAPRTRRDEIGVRIPIHRLAKVQSSLGRTNKSTRRAD